MVSTIEKEKMFIYSKQKGLLVQPKEKDILFR